MTSRVWMYSCGMCVFYVCIFMYSTMYIDGVLCESPCISYLFLSAPCLSAVIGLLLTKDDSAYCCISECVTFQSPSNVTQLASNFLQPQIVLK